MSAFIQAQSLVRAKLLPSTHPVLFEGARQAQDAVERLLKQALGGESVSALLIGPSGCGKTAAVTSAVKSLDGKVISVELNGNFCSDDRACMREIFWQMVKKMDRLNGEGLTKLTSTGSLTEWIAKLSQLLLESSRAGYLVLVVLDKFEEFCHCKSKQGLLYNLYDLMQQPGIMFACLGVTSKVDATDHLEKRIKSRFQLRRILVRLPHDFPELITIMTGVLNTKKRAFDEAVKEALSSKELRQNWQVYFDSGLSVGDFVKAAIRAILRASELKDVHAQLKDALHVFESSLDTESSLALTMRDLNLADHLVLCSLSRLHRKVIFYLHALFLSRGSSQSRLLRFI